MIHTEAQVMKMLGMKVLWAEKVFRNLELYWVVHRYTIPVIVIVIMMIINPTFISSH